MNPICISWWMAGGWTLFRAMTVGYVFRLAARPRNVRVRSRSGVPQELGLARDPRELGVALRHIAVAQQTRKRAMQANDVRVADGFHDFEAEKGLSLDQLAMRQFPLSCSQA